MRFKKYINELFNKPVDLKVVKDKWNKWKASFPVANDIYTITGTRIAGEVMKDTLTDKELKKLTGVSMTDVKKESERIKKDREEGRMRIPINMASRKISTFFEENPIWIIGFESKKFGDKILDIRTKEEVGTIYSGVKKGVEEFIKKVKPSFLIVDAKDPKRLKIYKRFVDEIMKRGGYKILGGKRKIDWGDETEHNTTGWILYK